MATQWTAGTVSGQILTAATMNTIGAAWETYTPTLTQGGLGLTKTINYARYCQFQKTIIVQIHVTLTGASIAGSISLSLPTLNPAIQFRNMGTMLIYDASAGLFYNGAGFISSNVITAYGQGGNNFMGTSTPTVTLAVNDQVSCSVMYEIA